LYILFALQAISKIEGDVIETSVVKSSKESSDAKAVSMGTSSLHRRISELTDEEDRSLKETLYQADQLQRQLSKQTSFQGDFIGGRSLEDCSRRSYGFSVKCRMAVCVCLYMAGIAVVVMAYGFHWFSEINRTYSSECVI